MIGLGTVINVVAILAGGFLGLLFGNFIPQRLQDTLLKANGVSVIFIGISGTLQQMTVIKENGSVGTQGTLMLIITLAIGSLIGEWINIDRQTERLGNWICRKTASKKKTGSKDALFTEGFMTATLTVCVGAMAIVGSIEDGVSGNYSTLLAKSVLDAITLTILSASLGKGCLFSAAPVAILQGGITLFANSLKPVLTDVALSNLSLVGSVLIFCVGVNLVRKNTFRVANMVPAIFLAVAWAFWLPVI